MLWPKSCRLSGLRGVVAELLEQEPGGEDVDAHRGQAVLGIAGDRLGIRRLLLEADDPAVVVDLHHAELRAPRRPATRRAPTVRSALFSQVELDHRPVVHLVDVIAGQDDTYSGRSFSSA